MVTPEKKREGILTVFQAGACMSCPSRQLIDKSDRSLKVVKMSTEHEKFE